MTARTKQLKQKTRSQPEARKGWIRRKTGLKILAVISILLAVFEAWQISSFKSPLESILWGIAFGASIWVIVGIYFAFTRLINRR